MAIEKNENYWNTKASIGLAWLNENDAGPYAEVLRGTLNLLQASASDNSEAERLWAGIRAMAGGLPNTFIKRGRGSSLSPEVQASVDSVVNAVETVFVGVFEAHFDLMGQVILPHGKTGGVYASPSDMADYFGKKARRACMVALKENRWDGTVEGGIPQGMTPPALNESEVTQEE